MPGMSFAHDVYVVVPCDVQQLLNAFSVCKCKSEGFEFIS